MKLHTFKILFSLFLVTFVFGGCTSPEPQNDTTAQNISTQQEESGLEKYMELVTSDNTQYETSKPDGFIRFRWHPLSGTDINFADEGEDYELYALVDPNFETDDLNATQVFYLEKVKYNLSTFYGPFETKHQDFTQ